MLNRWPPLEIKLAEVGLYRSTLAERTDRLPPAGNEAVRLGVSTLAERPFSDRRRPIPSKELPEGEAGRGDDVSRNVRELIDPTLGDRPRPSLLGGRKLSERRLFCDDIDDWRRNVRFVCTCSTSVCSGLAFRKAAAAAAEERRAEDC